MLLSESESLWTAILYHRLRHIENLGHDPGMLVEMDWYSRSTDVIEHPYLTILRTAIEYGVGAPPVLRDVDQEVSDAPDDTAWAAYDGTPMSIEEARAAAQGIAECHLEVGSRLDSSAMDILEFVAFARALGRIQRPLAVGYSPSSPSLLYSITTNGTLAEWRRAESRPAGLLQTLLQLFEPALPFAPSEYMALACTPRFSISRTAWHDSWSPTVDSLDVPVGAVDVEPASRILEELKAPNASDPPWRFGEAMGRLADLLRVARQHCEAVQQIVSESTQSRGNDDTAQDSSDDEKAEDRDISVVDKVVGVIRFLADNAAVLSDAEDTAAPPRVVDESHFALTLYSQPIIEERTTALECAKAMNLDAVVEMIETAFHSFPLDAIRDKPAAPSAEEFVPLARQIDSSLASAERLVRDAAKIAYGELRLKELSATDTDQAANASPGLARQHASIRESIEIARSHLDNGSRPYHAIKAMDGAVEDLVRQIAERHHVHHRGLEVSAVLHHLRELAKGPRQPAGRRWEPADPQLLVTVAIASAVHELRNRVSHNPGTPLDRSHAVFFLHGVSLLLGEV
jgi:hypothetical protein